jgi:purine-cytosine permease-like protein
MCLLDYIILIWIIVQSQDYLFLKRENINDFVNQQFSVKKFKILEKNSNFIFVILYFKLSQARFTVQDYC